MKSSGSFSCEFTCTDNNEALKILSKRSDDYIKVKIDFDNPLFDVLIGDLLTFDDQTVKITKITDTGVLGNLIIKGDL